MFYFIGYYQYQFFMRVVIQRVKEASVQVENSVCGSIHRGLLIFLGIESSDSEDDVEWLCAKIVNLRIFSDENGMMNLSVKDINGEIILVSQFTLHALTKKGNRPSFINAARPEMALPLYQKVIQKLEKEIGKPLQTGKFGANMQVSLINDGPVTIIIDSKNRE